MSAFIVEDRTINSIVNEIASRQRDDFNFLNRKLRIEFGYDLLKSDSREMFAKALFEMNCEAIKQSYGEKAIKEFHPEKFKFSLADSSAVVAVYKNLQCYLYQCCEGSVFESKLYQFMQTEVLAALADIIIRSLPEYEKSGWN